MKKQLMSIILKIMSSIDDKLGENSTVLDLSNITSICDYFVIASASSSRQVKAIVDAIEDKLSNEGLTLTHKEGYESGRWVLLDYGDIVIHIFHEEDREFYNLDGIWKDANEVNIDII
ncbi:ribosome silencing factor [Alkaliphilus sp. MSJ-5]|uniref:Ribosomal silencing factor RsfS n=1 Tax=Alkaliphilus flagellatus TaxID=2841507 RepID=A0ABS6G5F5_9FIRM|nr:ribosome silencing factor [Alkaliphilus flagellatus]MBU5677723.1 ribosome silencing factor [Alkaliphilus flagellatus]